MAQEPRYEVCRLLGSGVFGCVYLAVQRGGAEDGRCVALKRVEKFGKQLSREFEVLSALRNVPHCMQLLECFFTRTEGRKLVQNFVLERLEHSLEQVLTRAARSGKLLPMGTVKLHAYQLFRGLEELHRRRIVHRDLKPGNVLVTAQGLLKLSDFGSAKFLHAQNSPHIFARWYRAPELFFGLSAYDGAVDVWAAGCVLAEMVAGKPMFCGDTPGGQLLAILQLWGGLSAEQAEAYADWADAELLLRLPNCPRADAQLKLLFLRVSDQKQLFALLEGLFEYNPRRRLTAAQALAHPFFAETRADYAKLIAAQSSAAQQR